MLFNTNKLSELKRNYLQDAYRIAGSAVINYLSSFESEGISRDETPGLLRAYRHLQGEYTPGDPDIRVTSLDDGTQFTLTKGSLIDHPYTRRAITEESYGKTLMEQYSSQVLLIRGILEPMTEMELLSLKDGQMVNFDIPEIEPQELTLKTSINSYLENFRSKYDLNAFLVSDRYFNHAYLGILHNAIVVMVLISRHDRINTTEAHSFHVKAFLSSRSLTLDDIESLSYEQQRFLYSNINYLHDHVGRQDTLDFLVKGITKGTDIRITGYRPKIAQDDAADLFTVFDPISLVDGQSTPMTSDNYALHDTSLVSEELLAGMLSSKDIPSRTRTLLVDDKYLGQGLNIAFNEFALYMLLYQTSLGLYTGDVIIDNEEGLDIKLSVEKAVSLLYQIVSDAFHKEVDLVPCTLSLPVVYSANKLTRSYLDNIRSLLTAQGDTEHRILDTLILSNVDVPLVHSGYEFNRWVIDRYSVYAELTSLVSGIENGFIRVIYQEVLSKLYPPVFNLAVPGAGDKISSTVDFRNPSLDEDELLESLSTLLMVQPISNHQSLRNIATTRVLNTLTSYSDHFVSDKSRLKVNLSGSYLVLDSVSVTPS